MPKFIPFADDAVSLSIGELTFENGTDRIALHGSLDITRDKEGLVRAQALKAVLDQAVQHLQADKGLAERLPPPAAPKKVRNPFA